MSKYVDRKYTHIIVCVKSTASIQPSHASELYSFIRDIIKQTNSIDVVVNGTPDHIHVLSLFSEEADIHGFVQKLKEDTKQWLKAQDPFYRDFDWKKGYGKFLARPPVMVTVQHIVNQDFHHNTRHLSFDEELKTFFKYHRDTVRSKDKFWWDD